MKKLIALFAASIMIAISANVMAQSASASATATIITPISINKVGDLSFGKIVPSTTGDGKLAIGASLEGTKTPTGIISLTGNTNAASYTVSGDAGSAYTINLPSSITLNGPSSATMTVDQFVSSLTDNKGTVSATPLTNPIYVGATLTVKQGQATGTYTGTYNVTVAYN